MLVSGDERILIGEIQVTVWRQEFHGVIRGRFRVVPGGMLLSLPELLGRDRHPITMTPPSLNCWPSSFSAKPITLLMAACARPGVLSRVASRMILSEADTSAIASGFHPPTWWSLPSGPMTQ